MEKNFSDYPDTNWVNTKNNKITHSVTTSVEAMAFLMVTSISLVNNPANFINTTSPKQQINKNFRRKSDVNMSNNKNTSTQEVRQKDIDHVQAIEDEKISNTNKNVDKIEQNLTKKIDETEKNLEKAIKESKKSLNQRIDDLKDANDKSLNKTMTLVTVIIAILQLFTSWFFR